MPPAEETKITLELFWESLNLAICAGLPALGLMLGIAIDKLITWMTPRDDYQAK